MEGINSVQSIAIDWLGRKIYWADPSKQSVITNRYLREKNNNNLN